MVRFVHSLMDSVQLLDQTLPHFLRYQDPLALYKNPINDCNVVSVIPVGCNQLRHLITLFWPSFQAWAF